MTKPLQFLYFNLLFGSLVTSATAGAAATTTQAASSTITAAPTNQLSLEPQYFTETLFTSALLNSTNFYRAEHNAVPLSWNTSLESFAANYLESSGCNFAHSGGPYGENLATGYDNVTAAVDAWGNERNEYDFSDPGFSEQTGHFTQLVWKATTTVGCARLFCGSVGIGWYLVCEYSPRGNIIGQFGQEVQKQVSGPPAQISVGSAGPTAEGNGGVQSSDTGGGCPQGAACDGGNLVRAPWCFQKTVLNMAALIGYVSFWMWV